ncbi:MAG: transglutaminase family protein [Alphaproteobacteria bacterium]
MLLDIRHQTEYRYSAPVRESQMEVRMQPRTTLRQRLVSFELSVEPAAQVFSYVDHLGNIVQHFDVAQPHDGLMLNAHMLVETGAPPPLPEALEQGAWEQILSDKTRSECFDFLRPHGFAAPSEKLADFSAALDLDEPGKVDPLTAVRRLTERLYEGLAYSPGVTEADSPIDLALDQRSGVCQDFTHIMIAICRGWGVPARYISGYLFTDREHDRSRPDASHAWVETFLPGLGWVGFDPVNNAIAGERHVAVGWGRDYSDVPPSRGVFKGDADSELFVAVSTARTDEAVGEMELIKTLRSRSTREVRTPPGAAYREYQQQ